MSQAIKTDNSNLEGKIRIREIMIKGMTSVKVLDTFAGKGLIWKEIQKRNPGIDIKVTGIEIEKSKNPNALLGDNLKVIPSIDLSPYDFIDIDAYGSPYKQLRAISQNGSYKDNVIIATTNIQTALGKIPDDLLYEAGITKKMIKNAQVLCNGFGDESMISYLGKLGVKDYVAYEPTTRKKYWTFRIKGIE